MSWRVRRKNGTYSIALTVCNARKVEVRKAGAMDDALPLVFSN